jgi:hypothetical protein
VLDATTIVTYQEEAHDKPHHQHEIRQEEEEAQRLVGVQRRQQNRWVVFRRQQNCNRSLLSNVKAP